MKHINRKRFIFFVFTLTLFSAIIYAFPCPPLFTDYKELANGNNPYFTKNSADKMMTVKKQSERLINGEQEICVILLQFQNKPHQTDIGKDTIDSKLFGSSNSFKNYYNEVSYGKLALNGEIYDNNGNWYKSSKDMEYYGKDSNSGIDNANVQIYEMAREAVVLADNDIDFSKYDKDGDSVVDYVIIIHAGNSQETSGNSNDIWSHFWKIDGDKENGTGIMLDNKYIKEYMIFGENSSIGVIAHEFGHALGLPDLYDIDYSSAGVGDWDLMGYGLRLNNGNTPSHLSIWCKQYLGWVSVSLLSNPQDSVKSEKMEINSNAGYKSPIKIYASPLEYFLLENRQKYGYDYYLPGHGLLIWHIDDSIGTINNNDVNANEYRKRVTLVEANGEYRIAKSQFNRGSNDDPFPGTLNITSIDRNTKPNTNMFGDTNTFIELTNIREIGEDIYFDYKNIRFDTTDVLSYIDSYIYPNPVTDKNAKFQIIAKKPITNIDITIYDLNGGKVKKIASNEITITNAFDNKIIYSSNWNCKNDDNQDIAGGVYFGIIKIENEIKKIMKIAVIK